jgi:hypothetical protein
MKLGFYGVQPEFYEEVFVCLKINKEVIRHKNMMLTYLFLYRKPFNFTGVGFGGMDTFLRISSICQTYPWTSCIRDIMPLLFLSVGCSSGCRIHFPDIIKTVGNTVKVKFNLEQTTKPQSGSTGIAVLFL